LKPVCLLIDLLLLFCLLSPIFLGQGQAKLEDCESNTDPCSKGGVSVNVSGTGSNCLFSADYPVGQNSTESVAGSDCAEVLAANMKLKLCNSPTLGTITELGLTVSSEVDAQNTELRIVLPEGFSLSWGNLCWRGDLLRNRPVAMSVFIEARMIGVWRIEAIAISKPSTGLDRICSTHCYVQVSEKEGHVLAVPSEHSSRIEAGKLDGAEKSASSPRFLSGTTIAYGQWYYENQFGECWPARYARVELWNKSLSGDVLLATTSVQGNGSYEFPAVENDGVLSLYVKLFCRCQTYPIVKVYDPDFVLFWSQTDARNVSEGYLNMGIWTVRGNYRQCWRIYDSVLDGYFWLLNKTGWSRSEVCATLWENPKGSYCLGNEMIIYPSDGWIESVVLHEYGHCINFEARGGSFPHSDRQEDEHYPDTEADQGWALREGWAEFFECAVLGNPAIVAGNYYGSLESTTFADGPFGHGDYGDWDGEDVEGAVAQVFWDIYDGESNGDYPVWDLEAYGDHICNKFDQLWNIFLHYRPDSIHEFWRWWSPKDVCLWEIFRHARIIEPRDIAVTDISPFQENVVVGETVCINITVENRGQTVEYPSLTLFANSLSIGLLENVTLEPFETKTFTFTWSSTGFTNGLYVISGQAFVFPEDLNTTDDVNMENTVAILLPGQAGPGDVNIDGIVNIIDLVVVALQFGRPPPQIGDPRADIDLNGKVNILDLVVVALHYGDTG
jgi:Dockerin type I domain